MCVANANETNAIRAWGRAGAGPSRTHVAADGRCGHTQGARATQRCPASSGGVCAAGNSLQGDIHVLLGW